MPWGVFCHLGSPFPAGKSPCLVPAPHQQALSLCSDSSGHIQVSGAARGLQVVPKTSHRLSAFGWRHCGLGTPPVGSGYMEGGPLGAVGTGADVLEDSTQAALAFWSQFAAGLAASSRCRSFGGGAATWLCHELVSSQTQTTPKLSASSWFRFSSLKSCDMFFCTLCTSRGLCKAVGVLGKGEPRACVLGAE